MILSRFLGTLLFCHLAWGHEAKDFDDSVIYKIDFAIPDFEKEPDLKSHLRTFYTHEHEKYDCVIPVVEEKKEEKKTGETELSPITLLQPMITTRSCSYRIEAYWSYEICHGLHVRQYHEEREGKNIKFQEYYLGRWSEEKQQKLEESVAKAGASPTKYKTTKIDNIKYPYFEMELTDGTMCDIINAPRTTIVRYVCYPHGKNEIYSFKETSSCNYEAIVLTSVLCIMPAFYPEESKEVSIKCFNSPTEPHKPLSMLRQELNEMQVAEDDLPIPKEMSQTAAALSRTEDRFMFLNKLSGDVDKFVLDLMENAGVNMESSAEQDGIAVSPGAGNFPPQFEIRPNVLTTDLMPAIREFVSDKNCLTGGTGWWKYEFCFGRHVRQFHKDKKSETELFLGYFSKEAHLEWNAKQKNDRGARRSTDPQSLWHHYSDGTRCDRTGLPREVEVKLNCKQVRTSATIVSMYLLEPKTCQYILVVESPIICELLPYADENGLIDVDKLNAAPEVTETPATQAAVTNEEIVV